MTLRRAKVASELQYSLAAEEKQLCNHATEKSPLSQLALTALPAGEPLALPIPVYRFLIHSSTRKRNPDSTSIMASQEYLLPALYPPEQPAFFLRREFPK